MKFLKDIINSNINSNKEINKEKIYIFIYKNEYYNKN